MNGDDAWMFESGKNMGFSEKPWYPFGVEFGL